MTKSPENSLDPWDPESLALSQDFSATGETEEQLTSVGLGKFSNQAFVRAHETFFASRLPFIKLKDDLRGGQKSGEWYFVGKEVLPLLADRVIQCTVYPLITQTRQIKLWPIPMDTEEGNWHSASSSGTVAVKHARLAWVQIEWTGKAFITKRAKPDYGVAPWFEGVAFADILRLGLEYRTLDTPNHTVVRQLQGIE